MKSAILLLATATLALANTAPTVVIQSAAMRPGTTLMDVVYRVNDPDDATVKTRALAFVDGVRSFAKVIKPVTFVEGTAAKLGDAIPANVDHTVTWDVGADWDIDLGQIKFEVLAMDARGLLPIDWITIPAAGGNPALTVSKNSPTNAEVLNALFWRYAIGDGGLKLENGILSGNSNSGVFHNVALANGSTPQFYAIPFVFKRMNLDPDDGVLATTARAGLTNPQGWHAANRNYVGLPILTGWGRNSAGPLTIDYPSLVGVIVAISAGYQHCLALKNDGTVVGWGYNNWGQATIPAELSDVVAISAGSGHSLALKKNGTVIAWGYNNGGQSTIPAGLSGVTAISAGSHFSFALKNDGTVIGWGHNSWGQTTIPDGLSNLTAIAAGDSHCLALKNDGTVVGWGYNQYGQTTIPAGLSGVIAIAACNHHNLALKNDGTVIGWGSNEQGQTTIPAGLSGVIAIKAGGSFSHALKNDGTLISWGRFYDGANYVPMLTPAGLAGVTSIAAGANYTLTLTAEAP